MKHLFVVLTVVVVALTITACTSHPRGATPTSTAKPSAFPMTIKQSDDVDLEIAAPPKRIVSLSTHSTEDLCSIGAGDQLAAVEGYANCPAGSKVKPELDAFKPNLEAIVGYQPDLVYVSSDQDGIVEALRRVGTPVLYLKLPSSLNQVVQQIELFGRISDHDSEAQALVTSMRARIAAVTSEVQDVASGPRVYHELDPTYFSAAPNSFVGDFYTVLKAQNIAAGAENEYPQLSAEVIVERDPEVIVLADEPGGITADSVTARPGWSNISAVRNRRVCEIEPTLVSVPGPRVVDGLDALAKCLYPDRFP